MSIINVRKSELIKLGYKDFEDWNSHDNHVYIGRNMSFYVKGTFASKWANPYSVKKYGREEALQLYKTHIVSSGLIKDIDELKGKVLGCWCAPEKCHGDILLEILG